MGFSLLIVLNERIQVNALLGLRYLATIQLMQALGGGLGQIK